MTPHMKKLIAIACVSLACAASSARIARVGAVGGGMAASAPSLQTPSAPGALAFASERYGVTEGAGSAKIGVRRVGGTDGEVVGKVTLTDVTTSPADYRFSPGARDPAFNPGGPGANDFVGVVAVQPDGKVVIGGVFTAYNGDASAPNYVMRLNADGTRDTTFNPGGTGANVSLRAVALQPDGKIIIGGFFTAYNGDESAPDGVMRLNADGTRDASFNPGGSGAGGLVTALAMQPDGKIIFSGDGFDYNGDGSGPRNVMRLNADGTRDTAFNPGGTGAIGPVHALAVQPDGKIIIGGFLRAYNGDLSAPDGVMRLNADGTRDTAFNPGGAGTCCAGAGGTDAYVSEVAVQPDGKVVIGGFFTGYNGDGSAPRNVMRLNADGTRDTAFNPGSAGTCCTGPNGSVRAALQPDGKVIIYGSFTAYNGDPSAPDNVMRLNADGTRDPAFNPGGSGAGGVVYATAVQPDGKVLVGGEFTAYNGDESAPDAVMRLNADGTPDIAFNPGGAGVVSGGSRSIVRALALQPDGKIIIGGFFRAYNGDESAPDAVMRLNADGTRDTTFNPGGSGVGGSVNTLAVQPDGKVLVGGEFGSYNGDSSAPDAVMRLNSDGTRDTSFNPGGAGARFCRPRPIPPPSCGSAFIFAVAVQPDGKILIGGVLHSYNDEPASDGVMRLNSDGRRDTSFNPGANGFVAAMALQPDGKILIGGAFTAYNGDPSAPDRVMRLNSDGTRDTSFNPGGAGAGETVVAMALQPDGKIVIGGGFTAYNGDPSAPDAVMRLNADGTRDTSFNPGGAGANRFSNVVINSVALQPDGKIIIGSDFNTTYNGDPATASLMRLDGDLFVTWRPGDAAEKVVQLPIVDDGVPEAEETLTLSLSVVSGGAALGSPHSATLTIGGGANPIDDAPNFVRQHYYDFLSREPDTPGLAFWTDQVTNCVSPNPEVCRINVSAAFFLSIEFGQTAYLVERMHKVAYGDATGVSALGGPHQVSVPVVRFSEFVADAPLIGDGVIVGQGDWEARLAANKVAYAQAFVRRQRFRAVYDAFAASPTRYVDRLNENAGGVVTDSGERISLINEAAAGTDEARASVLRKIAEHPELSRREFNRAFVLMQYFGYLRRDPAAAPDADHTGYEFWLRKLDGFGGDYVRAEMVKAFISSDEYRKRFAQ